MTGAQPPRMTRANPAGSCRIMSGVATSWRVAWSWPRTFHDACPHSVARRLQRGGVGDAGQEHLHRAGVEHDLAAMVAPPSGSWASPWTTATTWMPLPPESDSQDGSGTGQIWVTSSRPIKSGGSRRPDADAWPICAAASWISVAIAANSGATGASSDTASAIM